VRGRVSDTIPRPRHHRQEALGAADTHAPRPATRPGAAGAHHEADRPVIRSYRGSRLKANSIVNWFVALFLELGYEGCSSHSGRRSFITMAARNVHRSGCSLHDVQLLAGHLSIETTERYIDGDTCAQRRLVWYV